MAGIKQCRTIAKSTRWESIEGSIFPLGVSYVESEDAFNFTIYSKHAQSVTLNLYAAADLKKPLRQFSLDTLQNKSGPIWHCRIPASQIENAQYYAYQVSGPPPEPGFEHHTFDAEKILLDPYVQVVYFPPEFDRNAAIEPGSNAGVAPLGVLRNSQPFDWGDDCPVRHDSTLVIYEMHVRGFTQHPSSQVAESDRGTFQGVIDKIPYLKDLGITAVELMPIFQFDPHANDYWGYMPISFFAPHNKFASTQEHSAQHCEFREMVRALHAADIEVILDVVYNHTGEGDQRGPTYSFKGIDNSTYYLLQPGSRDLYANFSGTGNTLHTANRAVRQMIIDSMRYWVSEMHVDGFRFDLASVFTRNDDGSINLEDPPIFGQIAAEDELAGVRLIAEPWDAGGAYQLGSRFPGVQWMQWNGNYRDSVQKFVRGDQQMVSELMTRVYGSADLFPDDLLHSMRPFQSVNYVTSHDGFTLNDLVSFNHKNNWSNGNENKDGHDDYSWNCGIEGNQNVPAAVRQLRIQQAKNLFCLLMLSNGTPMFRMGDEFLHSQQGNSNPYNQDNELSWLDWRNLEMNEEMFRFAKTMIAFRKSHPSISRSTFWRDDVRWYGATHDCDLSSSSHCLAFCLHGASQHDHDIYVMINAWEEVVEFGIYEGSPGEWRRVIDTSQQHVLREEDQKPIADSHYSVEARSVVVFTRKSMQPSAMANSTGVRLG
jgi:glycogen operon protein